MKLRCDTPLEVLAREWLSMKHAEEECAARRREIAALIEARMPGDAEGTSKADAGGLQIVLTRKLKRAVDAEALRSAWDSLPDTVQRSFRWKPDVDLKALRALEFASADAYRQAAQFVTTEPAACALSIREAA